MDGILLQLPLPAGLDEGPLLMAIDPEKDADGLHTLNLGRLLKGERGSAQLSTPAGVMAMLRSNGIDPAGKRAVVIGRSILVGQPMALMLQAANHRHHRPRGSSAARPTRREADILVVAAGRPAVHRGRATLRPGGSGGGGFNGHPPQAGLDGGAVRGCSCG